MYRVAVTIAAFTLLEARRNRLLWLLAIMIVAGVGLGALIGEVAITETRQFQAGFVGAVLRLGAVLLASLFVISSLVRELDDKGLDLVLALPVTRASYMLGKLAGFLAVAVLLAALCSVALLLHAPPVQVAAWGFSLACELAIVTTFSLLCLFTFSQITPALSVVAAFYVLARAIGAIQLMGHQGPFGSPESLARQTVNALIDGLAYLLPSLDRFTSSEWLVYHTASVPQLLEIAGQSLVYVALLAAAALFDLYRKSL